MFIVAIALDLPSTIHPDFNTLVEFTLAIALSAAAGFRVFVPLLVLSAAAVFGHVDLPTQFDWIENPQALTLFAIACILEIIGYAIPWFDHALDLIATPAAILSGTIVTASLAPEIDPLAQWTLAVVAGGGTAGLTKIVMNLLRGTSTAVSGGLTNPLVAALELMAAIILSSLAIMAPVVAGAIVIGLFGFLIYKLLQWIGDLKKRKTLVSSK